MGIIGILIDGTGPWSHAKYTSEMATSFCSQIAGILPKVHYFRGPTLAGVQTDSIGYHAFLAATESSTDSDRLVLAGYSRGGCAAILAAMRLAAAGKAVDSLFLFDAVDMDFSRANMTQVIPANVRYVAHARTARDLGFWARYPRKSRFYFYNTGRWLLGSGTYEERTFVGTHGAAGGVPWPDVDGDNDCTGAVAEWMSARMARRGVPVQLRA